MNNIILVGIVGAVLGGMTLIGYLNEPIEAVNVKPETVIEEVQDEQVELDLIERANLELARINQELDAEEMLLVGSKASSTTKYEQEEARLLELQKANKQRFELEQEQLNTQIDRIQETRTSFNKPESAPYGRCYSKCRVGR